MKHRLLLTFIAISLGSILIGCGGGGGSSSSTSTTPAPASSTSYSSALAVGDLGALTINPEVTSYSLAILRSSFGLTNKTFSGSLSRNADGTYTAIDSTQPTKPLKLFKTTNLSVMAVPISISGVVSAYAPVFSIKSGAAITEASQIVVNTNTVRAVQFRSSGSSNSKVYGASGATGFITVITPSQFTLSLCDNGGISSNNTKLVSCVAGSSNITSTSTFNYDSSSSSWLMANPSGTSIVSAQFTSIPENGSVVGYIDTSDTSGNSSQFMALALASPSQLPAPLAGTFNHTSYQACTSTNNCAYDNVLGNGVDTGPITIVAGSSITRNPSTGYPNCTETLTPDSPIAGMYSVTHANCKPGSNPDIIGFNITQNLSFSAGYDNSVTPAAVKVNIDILY
ncbi:hypothetical protein [Polynucleobacter sp. Tro8-14-1]|uniref:hypothetical protein n=1 Tax=Polynucleobacter sp. Tro8-14-1 TaxID=1758383 RepID=UPI001C0D0A26|nr:hypothetical protein [Polynucleobacter sp. Tro8-14-1]MBU3563636.1 hypothetical protein [Polynucleobacter sp. Tro8-14-1]